LQLFLLIIGLLPANCYLFIGKKRKKAP